MNGPGLTTLPSIAQSSGYLTYVLLVMIAACVTSYVVQRLCLLMWSRHRADIYSSPVLQNSDFVALSESAWSHGHSGSRSSVKAKKYVAIAMVGCALALALAQMMLCAKIGDAMFVASPLGSSCGINPVQPLRLHCTSNLSMKPFQQSKDTDEPVSIILLADENPTVSTKEKLIKPQSQQPPPMSLITAGLVIASTITILLASVDLDSMITSQYVLFGCLLLACMRFCVTLTSIVPEISDSVSSTASKSKATDFYIGPKPFNAVGPILFNFAFVVTVPPLSCGSDSAHSSIRALVISCVIMGLLYILIGCVGASAAAYYTTDDNLLSLVLHGTSSLDVLSVSIFGVSQLAAIPVYCELGRETLVSHLHIPNKVAFYLCHVAPWIICSITYNSEIFESFVEWSSLLLLGFANFSLPLLLDLMIKEHGLKMNDGRHKWIPGAGKGPDAVLWTFSIITASIAAVIVQQFTSSILVAEVAFMATVLLIFFNY